MKNRLADWKNKFLSFAGRFLLIIYVLSSMQIYWSSVFMIPTSIVKQIEKLIRGFLWCQGVLKHGKAKVPWDIVCLPKSQGRLCIRNLELWNVALMSMNIRNILIDKKTLFGCVEYIHIILLVVVFGLSWQRTQIHLDGRIF